MGDPNIVTNQPVFSSKKRTAMELSKALSLMGYGTWNNLEPGEQGYKSKAKQNVTRKEILGKIQ